MVVTPFIDAESADIPTLTVSQNTWSTPTPMSGQSMMRLAHIITHVLMMVSNI